MSVLVAASDPPREPHPLWEHWESAITGSGAERELGSRLLSIGCQGFFEHQRLAFDRILTDGSVFLTAGTSSGKTLAVALPLLERLAERQIRRACFVYPTRALLEGQRAEVGELAELRGLTTGVAMGGRSVAGLLDAMASRVIFATPDEIYWYFARTAKHAGALAWALTQVDDFVFDEIHAYRSYTLNNLVWFLRRLQALNPSARFHFLSATTSPELFHGLQQFGNYGQPLQGSSFSGPVTVDFAVWGPVTWRQRDLVLEHLSAGDGDHTVAIFNSARFVHRFSLRYRTGEGDHIHLADTGRRLFRYTGYMDRRARDGVISEFQRDAGVLLTTSAAEVGVDLDCDRLLMEEFGAESTIQRFGRAGRGGQPAEVTIIAQPGLEDRVREHLTSSEPSREQFVAALKQALGGYEHLARTSHFAAYTQYVVNLGLGSTGRTLNDALFTEDERARFESWAADGTLIRYGLRSVMPQVKLANGARADPFYILQLAPASSLVPAEDARFDIAVATRTYDSLVWEPFAFDVLVDSVRTFPRGQFIDTDRGRLVACQEPAPGSLSGLWPRGTSRVFPRPEGPILKLGAVRVGLCFGDVVLRRTRLGDSVAGDPSLVIPGWYYLLLCSEDSRQLGILLSRLVYPNDDQEQEPPGGGAQPSLRHLSFNRGARADLIVARASESPHYAFVLETAYGACYEIWQELCDQSSH
jgi:hypothetical protein